MKDDGDLESVVCSCPPRKEEGSNARGGDTQYNLLACSEMVAECPVDKGLSTASCSLKKETLTCPILNCSSNLSKGSLLLHIKLSSEMSGRVSLLFFLIV